MSKVDKPTVVKPQADETKNKQEEIKIEEPKNEMEKWKLHFAKQPKKSIMIPREKSDPVGAYETVQINGYTFQITKGVYVEVPEQIAQIIMESQQQTEQAIATALKKIPEDERMVFDNTK
jgi:hypothetical protein